MGRHLCCVALVWAGCSAAAAAPAAKAEAAAPFDIAAVKDKLHVFADDKKHYLALVLTPDTDSPVFWSSDGKDFYQLRIFGGGSEGAADNLKRLDRVFWEPRVSAPYQASFDFKQENGASNFEVQCSNRKTVLQDLAPADAKTVVDGARFHRPRWNHRAYALARDNTGKYYYIDRQREPEEAKNFRLWAGPKGAMKPQKMLNVVSDSQGDIFSTKRGELRLILSQQESTWIERQRPVKLTWVPVEDNHVLIYTDLGVYAGEPLGTPCDDL
jgi:hypothetical protein